MIAAIVVAGALGTALVAFVLAEAFRPEPPPAKQAVITPAEETVTPTLPVDPVVPGAEETAQPTPAPAPTRPKGSAKGFVRAPKIAFRVGDTVYVAAEDGSGAAKVASSAFGPYALSPDGKTLAVVDGTQLRLIDVASGSESFAGPAEAAPPVWRPDSSAVLFVRAEPREAMHVWEVKRDGSGASMLVEGVAASVSPDGKTVVARRDVGPVADGGSGKGVVYVSRDGAGFRPVTVDGQPTAVAVLGDRALVGLYDSQGVSSVISMGLDGRGVKGVLGAASKEPRSAWSELWVSPDGARVAAVATGDDGHSRVSVVDMVDGSEKKLSGRRDGYMRGWTASGEGVLLLEGNYFQGESTALMRVSVDGAARVAVVTGAE